MPGHPKVTILMCFAWIFAGCSGRQSSPDAGEDQKPSDAGVDAGDEGAADGRADGGGDVTWEEPWVWCPQTSEYVGGDWSYRLDVAPDALYCSVFDEGRTLDEELAAKSRVRLVAGSYPVPSESGSYPFLLPVCFEFLEPDTQPVRLEVGEIQANHVAEGGGVRASFTIRQPVYTAGDELWEFSVQALYLLGPGEDTVPLNADFLPVETEQDFDFWLCANSCRFFGSCRLPLVQRERHVVEFEGTGCTGVQNHCHVELILRADPGLLVTGPGVLLQAAGELDGTAFAQENHYMLVYNPEHHHFSRDFAVLFESPIGGACGIKIEKLMPQADQPEARLTTIQCDLAEIEERSITATTWEQLPD